MPDADEAQRCRTPGRKSISRRTVVRIRFQFCCLNQRPTELSCKSSVFNSPEEDRMRKPFCRLMLVLPACCLLAAPCLGNGAAEILKRQERSTISLELEFA